MTPGQQCRTGLSTACVFRGGGQYPRLPLLPSPACDAILKQKAEALGKWLYGRLPVHAPLAIFCAPFIRCVQTADAIAAQLEGWNGNMLAAVVHTAIMNTAIMSDNVPHRRCSPVPARAAARGAAQRVGEQDMRRAGEEGGLYQPSSPCSLRLQVYARWLLDIISLLLLLTSRGLRRI